ncbi:MAG: hypothetical protein HY791_07275 [Deltaproteobacteria bacterium]|nr:hypothetical protein [Deltaproteobacteria bacterium]
MRSVWIAAAAVSWVSCSDPVGPTAPDGSVAAGSDASPSDPSEPNSSDAGAAPAGYCGGELAETTFRFGLCLCEDLGFASVLSTDGYVSSLGAYTPGGAGGSVGVNGIFRSYGATDIGGSLYSASDIRPVGDHDVKGQLHCGGDVTAAGDIHVFDDAFVAGDLIGIRTRIDGALHVPASSRVGVATSSREVIPEPVTVPPPCDCTTQRVDILGVVAGSRASNDNASVGLTPDAWTDLLQPVELSLPPGRYFVERIRAIAPVTLKVSGPTAIFVAEDLAAASIFEIELDGNRAELDLFVAGSILATGNFELGTRRYPARVRTYVAGSEDIRLAGDLDLGGNLFAPNARLIAAGPLDVYGAVLARGAVEAGVFRVHFDRDVLRAGEPCRTGQPWGPPPAEATNPPQRNCKTCLDCANQACNGSACGPCATSADCCAPLVCVSGSCQVLDF